MPAPVITPDKATFICKHYLDMSIKEIAKKLEISRDVVGRFFKEKGLQVPKELQQFWKSEAMKKPFTDEEHSFIHAHIRTHSTKWIAKELKRSSVTIRQEVHRLGYFELMKEKAEKSRYQKGRTPENKGVKMSPETYEKVKHTFFKSGHLPHNSLPDYTEVIRHEKKTPYIYIKIPGKRKAIPKHRHLWEQAHGAIPKGHNIIFKNGNTLDCRLENLTCVSNEELMQQNTIHRYPVELKTAIKQISKIKKQLNK
jgi:phage domain-containing protein 1